MPRTALHFTAAIQPRCTGCDGEVAALGGVQKVNPNEITEVRKHKTMPSVISIIVKIPDSLYWLQAWTAVKMIVGDVAVVAVLLSNKGQIQQIHPVRPGRLRN